MVQLGDVATVTISVLLMKPLLIVPCLRHRATHHCGDPDPSWWFEESTHLALNVSGKWVSMVLSLYLGKLSA